MVVALTVGTDTLYKCQTVTRCRAIVLNCSTLANLGTTVLSRFHSAVFAKQFPKLGTSTIHWANTFGVGAIFLSRPFHLKTRL
jgi:hypothetical protein